MKKKERILSFLETFLTEKNQGNDISQFFSKRLSKTKPFNPPPPYFETKFCI